MELKLLSRAEKFINQSSNRTFMELKFLISKPYINTRVCSNRTFMELK